MDMKQYFEEHTGFGVLCTSDSNGRVNAAVYARPHCFEDGTVGFIMPDRLTHSNLQTNDYAMYLFHEDTQADGHGYKGKRIYLRKLREDEDQSRISKLRRRTYDDERDGRYLVIFSVESELPLVGTGE
jgi:hypothetical protein